MLLLYIFRSVSVAHLSKSAAIVFTAGAVVSAACSVCALSAGGADGAADSRCISSFFGISLRYCRLILYSIPNWVVITTME